MSGGGTPEGGWYYDDALGESDLPALSRLLGRVLNVSASQDSGMVRASMDDLAHLTGLKSRRTVEKYLEILRADGFVHWRRRHGRARSDDVVTYMLTIPEGYPTRETPTLGAAPLGVL
jgi:hypothetical protein